MAAMVLQRTPGLPRFARAADRRGTPAVMRTSMMTRATVATIFVAGVVGCYLAISGGPMRVHVATFLGVVVAFVVPALFIERPRDLWIRRWTVLATVSAGIVVLDVGMTATIAKKEILDAPALFLAGIPAMVALLALHGLIVQRAGGRRAA